MIKNKILILYSLIFIVISAYLSVGTGRMGLFGGYAFYINTIYLAFSIFLFLHLGRAFWLFFLCILFLAFYAPVGILNGALNNAFVMAIWGTYASEATDFVKGLPIEYILLSVFSVLFLLFAYFKMPRVRFSKREIFALFAVFVVATATGKLWKIAPSSTIIKAVRSFGESYEDLKFYKNVNITPQWQITKIEPKYKNYIVVIGESVRRDYMHTYGYSVQNTPFLDSVNGVIVDGFHATGVNTIPNLKNLLNHKQDYNLNIIDLANLAGFDTYWLSNQGYFGPWDTSTTIVAKRAKENYFLLKDRTMAKKTDTNLVKKFVEIYNQKSEKPRVFFIHLIGSHPIFCNKLTTQNFKSYQDKETFNINCYSQTIAQTDSDLGSIYEALDANFNANNENYSMVYFSDHGLTHIKKYEKFDLAVKNKVSKQALEIPLFRISSDDTTRKFVKNVSYNDYFPESFAKWIGVETKNIEISSDIFDEVVQEDRQNISNLIKQDDDIAIDISKFVGN